MIYFNGFRGNRKLDESTLGRLNVNVIIKYNNAWKTLLFDLRAANKRY